eukprot:NODE_97_length_2481_cov_274.176398_g77_i0.p1 GENE.NODE_97_length_2481_cov_274.176398_g77_i0~~NODE_97_length_2481_cov_274.176398_g77_i0.p1  ORF type:complete len:741 (-),score=191.97 NODE_97_length_2481_cov_274.176398_g77_i0:134-2356(-)
MSHALQKGSLVINKKSPVDTEGAKERWETIENAIYHIYQENASTLSFQNLYTSGYQIILHKYGDILYHGVEETITAHIAAERGKVLEESDSSFLRALLAYWDRHRTAVSMIRDILMYMDKNYVPQHKKLGVYDLGVKIFGDCMLKDRKILERVRSLTLQIIQAERNGETAPQRMLLKNLTGMMTEVGKRDVYEPCLEEHFLKDSSEYYSVEAANYFTTSTTPDYIKQVFKRLDEERDRVQRCLDDSTKAKIENVIKQEMIAAYKQPMIEKENTGCLSMLRDWRVGDLRLLYDCMKLINETSAMVQVVKEFLLDDGIRLVTDPEANHQPLQLLESVLALRDKYSDLLGTAFSTTEEGKIVHDKAFEMVINKAFEDIFNKNPRFPEYLSLFIDSKLRKGKTQVRDEEFDIIFDKVLVVFRYLKEKDVFEKYYKNHLAKRLLGQKSSSEDAERSFITKLKTEYGYQFTSKLEGMFQDIKISQDTNESYRHHLNSVTQKPVCDMVVQVLTTTYWPVPKTTEVTLPGDVNRAAEHFKHYYLAAHSGRTLQYQFNMGNVDVKLRTPTRSYELNVSTHQMVILLLFNTRDAIPFMELQEQTKIPELDLKRALLSLCHQPKQCSPLLKKEPANAKDVDATLIFNEDFKSRFIKVKVSQMVQKETDDQARDTRSKVDEDRKWQLDAVIVRVMKSRKVMEHRMLIVEIIRQVSGRFTPSPDEIKKRIESLIERDYMQRSPESRSKYTYLA